MDLRDAVGGPSRLWLLGNSTYLVLTQKPPLLRTLTHILHILLTQPKGVPSRQTGNGPAAVRHSLLLARWKAQLSPRGSFFIFRHTTAALPFGREVENNY